MPASRSFAFSASNSASSSSCRGEKCDAKKPQKEGKRRRKKTEGTKLNWRGENWNWRWNRPGENSEKISLFLAIVLKGVRFGACLSCLLLCSVYISPHKFWANAPILPICPGGLAGGAKEGGGIRGLKSALSLWGSKTHYPCAAPFVSDSQKKEGFLCETVLKFSWEKKQVYPTHGSYATFWAQR